MTAVLTVEHDPSEVGVDVRRLAVIDTLLGGYVDDGRLAGAQVRVSRRGRTVHSQTYGMRDREAGTPVEADTLWRIYSMTKPITAVAAMQLVEQGRLRLNDEISRWLPEFADMRILVGGSLDNPSTVPATQPIRVWHLLTHTAGLTYAFTRSSLLDELYRAAGADPIADPGPDLTELCRRWAALPLLFEPGRAWNYSVATDVLGRLVEVVAGEALDEVFTRQVFQPLGMVDTRWWVDDDDASRLAALYTLGPEGRAVRHDALGSQARQRPSALSGGGGLISTAADYARFTAMLLGGGAVGETRLLGPRTVAYMSRNHLPGGATLAAIGRGQFAETGFEGTGFGLGVAVAVDPVANKVPANPGEITWGGLASTAFWVDPVEQLTVEFYTQLVPSSAHPIRTELRQVVQAALVD